MKNHPLINPETGKEEWISRAMAVLVTVFAQDQNGEIYVLANQRGPNTPDPEFRGCWCVPCGYLDYDETLKEAVIRECFEETGIKLSYFNLNLVYINDEPNEDKRQNVTFRYSIRLNSLVENLLLTRKNSEEGEVDNVKWISIKNINNYQWAFNHDSIITHHYFLNYEKDI